VSTLPSPAYRGAGAGAQRNSRRRGTLSATVLRLRVAAHDDSLDSALARGADPASRPQLAMRAAQLELPRHRRVLARTLRRFVDEASGSRPPARAAAVAISRGQILAHASDVLALADRLEGPQPAHAMGIAIAQRLVTDALESPLYGGGEPHRISRLCQQAVANMEDPSRHSFK
jgi:hypothetical protein